MPISEFRRGREADLDTPANEEQESIPMGQTGVLAELRLLFVEGQQQ